MTGLRVAASRTLPSPGRACSQLHTQQTSVPVTSRQCSLFTVDVPPRRSRRFFLVSVRQPVQPIWWLLEIYLHRSLFVILLHGHGPLTANVLLPIVLTSVYLSLSLRVYSAEYSRRSFARACYMRLLRRIRSCFRAGRDGKLAGDKNAQGGGGLHVT